VEGLPRLTESDVPSLGRGRNKLGSIAEDPDALCPICLVPFGALLAQEELANAMDSPLDDLGVTRLAKTCGHLFCRKDISTWIRDAHTSCPTCRTAIIDAPVSTAEPIIGDEELLAILRDASRVLRAHPPAFAFPPGAHLGEAGAGIDFDAPHASAEATQLQQEDFETFVRDLRRAAGAPVEDEHPQRRGAEMYSSMYS